ncbi:dynein axonemal assembly factor 6 isoform X3 [Lithobates pipiens]
MGKYNPGDVRRRRKVSVIRFSSLLPGCQCWSFYFKKSDMDEHLRESATTSSIQALCDLLHSPSEEEEEIESHCPSSSAFAGPGDIGFVKKIQQNISTSETEKDGKDIWHESEVKEGAEFDDFLDPREKPEYEILFKQRVRSEDIFLGLSRKDPSTACCEDMVIRIHLSDTKVSDVSLDVRKKYINLCTPKYCCSLDIFSFLDHSLQTREMVVCENPGDTQTSPPGTNNHSSKLGLHLPHVVNEKSGQAKFMVDTGTLELTLPMVRDMDFINFA